MRENMKDKILQCFQSIYDAHTYIEQLVQNENYEQAKILLVDCQNVAVQIGATIEKYEESNTSVVPLLEQYCEEVYKGYSNISEIGNLRTLLSQTLTKAEKRVESDIKTRKEIVFMPYKSSMWDSLESIWKAADEDPDCDAYVVPIPYYDRKPDFSLGNFHYEGANFPDYIPITNYEVYDFQSRQPDVIYIHNPYDEGNYVTSVDPRFYSVELRRYTKCLVYVPYFLAGYYSNKQSAERSIPLCINNVDICVLQSKVQKEILSVNQKFANKMVVLGSPKIDRIVSPIKKPSSLIGKEKINGTKVVLVNTSISRILNDQQWFEKMDNLIQLFKTRSDLFMLWRPHPLLFTTIEAMLPDKKDEMHSVIKNIDDLENSYIDRTASADAAIAVSDGLISDYSSLVLQYTATGKPVLLTVGTSDYRKTKLVCGDYFSNYFIQDGVTIEDFFTIIESGKDYKKEERMKCFKESIVNTDGTCGTKVHSYIKNQLR